MLTYFTDISTIAFTPTYESEIIGLPTKQYHSVEGLKLNKVIELK